MSRRLYEASYTVFGKQTNGYYKVAKSRNADLVVGGYYNYNFVKQYAMEHPNVYIMNTLEETSNYYESKSLRNFVQSCMENEYKMLFNQKGECKDV